MCAADKDFKAYLKQADQDDALVGGPATYLYNRWSWRATFWLSVVVYVSLM